MARTSDYSRFRARAVQLPWATLAGRHRKLAARAERTEVDRGSALFDDELLRRRALDIHLSWACGPSLGAPRGPFTVWTRDPKDAPEPVEADVTSGPEPLVFWGGTEAGCIRVTCSPIEATQPVAVLALRSGDGTDSVVSAAAAQPTGPGPLTLTVRTPGATYARVVNGTGISVAIEPLEQVVAARGWQPLELVGLPVDQPDPGFDYDPVEQGPVTDPMPPRDAAVHRLKRGGPPIGWPPVTEAGRTAPPWQAPDPERLVEEVRRELFPELPPMYDRAVPEHQQFAVLGTRAVDPPQQDGRVSSLSAEVAAGPWPMLMLPAQGDPFLNLACGFGASYSLEPMSEEQVAVGHCDFLVTAEYDRLASPVSGGAQMAAYAPAPEPHLVVPDPAGLTARLAGLVGPVTRDAPWRESVRLRWQRVAPSAGMSPVTEAALARYELGSTEPARSLLPTRDAGGDRPLLVGPDAPQGHPGHDRVALVDGGQDIPVGSAGRRVGYATAVSDVHGVWSDWQDVPWNGQEPAPQPPRLVSVALDTSYAGSPTCPARLRTEIAVEWAERTPTTVEVVALFFPMTTPTGTPPSGMSPDTATPPGCFRRDLGLAFAGDVPVPSGCTVQALTADGTEVVPAPGPAQGDGGRRYALSADVPTLDFATTPRWGVQLWVRRRLLVGASPTVWSPPPEHPARTSAASPVPVQPLPGPLPPGVPLGSTLDAQGCSHARVQWSLPSSTGVRTCVVWEVSETALRQRAGLTARAPETDSPGERLAALRVAYDGMSPAQRRSAFRRLHELPGSDRTTDVRLPKGSTDIHLFAVTTMTTSGVESPWPTSPGAPHTHLQAVIAPRLRAPAPPVVRASIALDGTVTIRLAAASPIRIQAFRLHRTTSEHAARELASMGPPFAELAVPATSTPADTDPVLGLPVWTSTWTGTLPARWVPWLLRAVAVPVDTVPVKAERGVLSAASDVAELVVPPTGPPDLDPLVAEVWGGDHRGVVVRTATSAPPRLLPQGAHRLDADAGAQQLAPVPLEQVATTALTTPPAGAATEVVLEQGARTAGQTPLALWFTRPVAADPVAVSLRLADPLGRVTTRQVTVPGWLPPDPGVHVAIVDVRAVAGRGVVLSIDTDAPWKRLPPYVLEIVARQRRIVVPPVLPPGPGLPPRPFRGPVWPQPRTMSASFRLNEVPAHRPGFQKGPGIQVVRRLRRPMTPGPAYDAYVPLAAPVTVAVSVVSPGGARVTATTSL